MNAEGVVTSIDDYEDDSNLMTPKVVKEGKESRGKFLSSWKRKKTHHQHVEQTRSHDLLSSVCQTLPHQTLYSTEDERGRRSSSLPPAQSGVEELRKQFESLSSSPTPPITPEDANKSHVTSTKHQSNTTSSGTETEPGTGIRIGRRNSNGNSDSGRESMIMESETVQPHV